MVNVVFNYFLLSPPRRMEELTCASGKFIASYQARYIATAARARVREEDRWTVDPRHGAWRGAAWIIRGGGVWSVKLASACSELAVCSLSSKDACRTLALDGHWSMPESLE